MEKKIMDSFRYLMPTEVLFGHGVVAKNADKFAIGKKAFIVTGKMSGKMSGALDDCLAVLDDAGIDHMVFEGIGNNPDVEQCKIVGEYAKKFGADFIIGIGGGSPLDASKAVAVFAVNDIPTERLFTYGYDNGILPIIAIPTTSGTGSEVTPWSVMTRHDLKTKRSFGGIGTYPVRAFLDPRYTESLSENLTKNTAMDAFTHCFESLISIKATPITDAINLYALGIFAKCMKDLETDNHDSIRDELMLVSMLGGIAISQTGTTIMHGMGYPLTYFYDLPHGYANCAVMPVYIDALRKQRPERLALALSALGMTADELSDYAKRNFPFEAKFTSEEVRLFAEQTAKQGSTASTGIACALSDIEKLYESIGKI